jgi:hypothetical protein
VSCEVQTPVLAKIVFPVTEKVSVRENEQVEKQKKAFLHERRLKRKALLRIRRERMNASAFCGLQKFFKLLCPHTLLGIGAPLDAGCAHRPGIYMAAFLTHGIRLIGPDLELLPALLAPDILRFRGSYFRTSWATFL